MKNYRLLAVAMSLFISTAVAAETVLEEIIVIAQKREQSVLDVPVAVSVLTGESLEASGISSVGELSMIAPSVRFAGSVSSSGQGMLIRGVGGAAFATGFEGSVGTMIDGVVTGPGGSSIAEFWDIERIEVLRGPQGTLFGKNTSAGAVNIISKQPTSEFEAEAGVRWGEEFDELRLDGVVSGPLSENLTGRVAAFWYDQGEGYVDNVILNDTENKKERWGIRLKTAYESGPLSVNVSLAYDEQDNNCCVRTFSAIDNSSAGALTAFFLLPSLAASGVEPSLSNRTSIADEVIFEDVENLHGVLEVAWELESGHVIKSITGYRDWEQEEYNDVDFLPLDVISGQIFNSLELFTQELQLLSPAGQNLEYVLGLYYYDTEISDNTILDGGTSITGVFGSTEWDNTVDVENIAVFGHATYKFSDQWSAYAGVRYISEDIDAQGVRGGNFFAFPGDFAPASASSSDNDWVGTAGVQFYPAEKTMVYASVSRGYKGSAIDTTIGGSFFTGNPNQAVLNPETVLSYELGVKTALLDGRVLLNAAAFMSEFDDFQATAFNGTSYVLRNAGVLDSDGVELDVTALLWEGATLVFNAAYIDATFDEFTGAPCTVAQNADGSCVANGGVQDLSGQPLNNSSEWQYTVNLKQAFKVGQLNAYAVAEYAWQDDVVFDGDLDPFTAQDSFGVANFRLGVTTANDRYDLALFARNAFDEDYSLRIADAPLYSGAYASYPAPGRSVGIELRASY